MIDKCTDRYHPECLARRVIDGTAFDVSECSQCGLKSQELELATETVGKQLQRSAPRNDIAEELDVARVVQLAKSAIREIQPPKSAGPPDETTHQFDTIVGDDDTTRSPGTPDLNDSVTGFKILRCIGTGGMGAVYLAQQSHPVQRQVALKLIKAGMDSQQVLARFDAEQQALALMDHPGIARVFEGGTTDRGHPFFAMEFVDGVPLTDYCDQNRLTINDRLRLFLQVCSAIGHAHQKGIIHRDIKPSNVLVGNQDGQPVSKVIDFGLAKALDFQLTDQTTLTRHFSAMGTLRYMSPEQAEGKVGDADTRTDIYSLGIVLFELLTGSTPLSKQQVDRESTHQLLQRIRSEDPVRPSVRIRDLGETSLAVTSNRRSDQSTISRELRRDLDWIVLKAIEIDRERRYETVSAFADDVQRYLAAEPIEARPPSTRYRIRKFVSKYRIGVGVAAVLATLLIAATSVSTSLYVAANAARERAERSERSATVALDRATLAEEQAIQERELARQSERAALAQTKSSAEMVNFLGEVMSPAQPEFLFDLSDPNEDPRSRTERMRQELSDTPLVQAELMNLVGGIYTGLGRVKDAEPLLLDAYQIRVSQLPEDDPIVADSLHHLAEFKLAQGRNDEGIELATRAIQIREAAFGPDDYRTLSSRSLRLYCQVEGLHMESSAKRFDVVRRDRDQFLDILARHSKSVPEDHIDIAKLHLTIGAQSAFIKDNANSIKHIGRAVAILRRIDPDGHLGQLLHHYVRSYVAQAAGNEKAMHDALKQAADVGPQVFAGNEFHPLLIFMMQSLASNEPEGNVAEQRGRESLKGCREIFGDEPRTAHALVFLGELLLKTGESKKVQEGTELLEEAIRIYDDTLGETHYRTGLAHLRLGRGLALQREPNSEQAAMHLRKALEICQAAGIFDYSYLDKEASSHLFSLIEKEDWIDRQHLQPVIDNLGARLRLHSGYYDTRYLRGSVHRALGEYAAAAQQHSHALRIVGTMRADGPADQANWIRAAMWASLSGQPAVYGPIRSEIVNRFAADKAQGFALPLAVVSLLYPCDQSQLQKIEPWLANAEPIRRGGLAAGPAKSSSASTTPEPTALAAGPTKPSSTDSLPEASAYGSDALAVARALLKYRSGNYESALQIANEEITDEIDDDRDQVLLRLIASLCHYRLDQPDEAKVAIAGITPTLIDQCTVGHVARQVQDAHLQASFLGTLKDYQADQLDWVACQTLWREVNMIGDLLRLDPNTALRVNSSGDDMSLSDDSVTLREAIAAANFFSDESTESNSQPREITFDPALFATPQTIRIDRQLPTVTCDLSIFGPGANLLTIDAGGGADRQPGNGDGWRIFQINDGDPVRRRQVDLRGLTITGGDHPSAGGAIRNAEKLTLTDVTVSASAAVHGGGLANSGELVATGCTFSGNSSFGNGGGGAINSRGGRLTNCTISGNTSSVNGGGIINYGPPNQSVQMTLTNCTLSGNTANRTLAGIYSFASGSATLTMNNTIVMGAIGGNGTIRGSHNLFGDTVSTTGKNELTDSLTDVAPRLGPLADNGGTTQTHALLPGSPAIDAGDPNAVTGEQGVPELDQRGAARITDDPKVGGSGIDIGAVEQQIDDSAAP